MNLTIQLTALVFLIVGFVLGKQTRSYVDTRQKSLTLDDLTKAYQSIGDMERTGTDTQVEQSTVKLSSNDVINHEGVGIIHRPSVEELSKMNESETERHAKEAIAQTIRDTPIPEI